MARQVSSCLVRKMKRPVIAILTLTLILSITLILTMFPFGNAAEPTKDTLPQVESILTQKKAVLVDVREPEETDEGYIEGAVLVPLSLLAQSRDAEGFGDALAEQIPPETIVYTYCKAGVRSATAADILAKFKYDVRALPHGYDDLVAAGFTPAKSKK